MNYLCILRSFFFNDLLRSFLCTITQSSDDAEEERASRLNDYSKHSEVLSV